MRSAALYVALGTFFFLSSNSVTAQTPQARLWDAAMSGDTAAIRQAVKDGAKVDSLDTRRNPNGRYALNWAAQYNNAPAVALLLALGAKLEAENGTGFSALNHAAEAGSLQAAQVLLAAGANPGHANRAGRIPLETARAHDQEEVARLLEAAMPAEVKKP